MASFLSALYDVTVTCIVSVASRSCAQARGEKILHCKVSKNFPVTACYKVKTVCVFNIYIGWPMILRLFLLLFVVYFSVFFFYQQYFRWYIIPQYCGWNTWCNCRTIWRPWWKSFKSYRLWCSVKCKAESLPWSQTRVL